jgi:Tol biopolymer transport system component
MKDEKGVKQIWMRSLDEGDPIPITRDTADCTAPSWAPKGGLIVFCRDEGFLGTPILRLNSVWLVAAPTGTPRRILQHGYNPSWSPDSKRVLYEDYRGLHTVNLEGADVQTVAGLPEMKFPMPVRRPRFSPDGTRIAFFHNDLGPAGDYWMVDADGTDLVRLSHRTDMGGGFAWAPDGKSLVVAAAWGGATNLWRVPVDGGDPVPVTSGAGEDTEPVVSGDGRSIVFSNARHEYALKVLDLGTRKVRTLREARSNMGVPEYSPDGASIVFFGGEEAGTHLLAVDRDGRNLRSLTRGPGEFHLFPQWSADGRGLYYYKKALDGASTWEWMTLGGGEEKVLRPGWTVHLQIFARVSPDGKRVVYLENRGLSTRPVTRVEELESGEVTELPVVLLYPRWSADGGSLLGFGLDGAVSVYEFATQKTLPLAPGFGCNWSRDGKHVYYLATDKEPTPGGGKHALYRIPVEGGESERIAAMGTIHPFAAIFDIGAHDDLAWMEFREGRKELWVLELE